MDDTHRPDVAMHMDMPGESKTGGIFAEGNLRRLGKHSISFRTDFYYNDVLAEMTMYPEGETPMYMQTWPSSGRAVGGLYVADNYSFSQYTKLKADARIDLSVTSIDDGIGKDQLEVFYSDFASTTSLLAPTFNFRLQQLFGKSVITEVHGGYGERLATLSEMYGFYLFNRNDGYDYVGNVNLATEKSWSGDLAITYFTNAFQVTVTGFYKYLRITFLPMLKKICFP
jgi:iron complex outermembrane receptor protein